MTPQLPSILWSAKGQIRILMCCSSAIWPRCRLRSLGSDPHSLSSSLQQIQIDFHLITVHLIKPWHLFEQQLQGSPTADESETTGFIITLSQRPHLSSFMSGCLMQRRWTAEIKLKKHNMAKSIWPSKHVTLILRTLLQDFIPIKPTER